MLLQKVLLFQSHLFQSFSHSRSFTSSTIQSLIHPSPMAQRQEQLGVQCFTQRQLGELSGSNQEPSGYQTTASSWTTPPSQTLSRWLLTMRHKPTCQDVGWVQDPWTYSLSKANQLLTANWNTKTHSRRLKTREASCPNLSTLPWNLLKDPSELLITLWWLAVLWTAAKAKRWCFHSNDLTQHRSRHFESQLNLQAEILLDLWSRESVFL